MSFTVLVSFLLLFTGVGEKIAYDNSGLITTYSVGDKAPTGQYFYIVSSMAVDSTSENVKLTVFLRTLC